MASSSSSCHADASCIIGINDHQEQQQLHPLSFSIVWSPLPPITWFLPFIGHMGITTSKGVACDFQGPYSVGDRGRMAFGRATRAVRIDVTSLPGEYISAPAVNNNIRYVPSDLRFMIHSCNIYTQFSTNATIMAHTHIHTHTQAEQNNGTRP